MRRLERRDGIYWSFRPLWGYQQAAMWLARHPNNTILADDTRAARTIWPEPLRGHDFGDADAHEHLYALSG